MEKIGWITVCFPLTVTNHPWNKGFMILRDSLLGCYGEERGADLYLILIRQLPLPITI